MSSFKDFAELNDFNPTIVEIPDPKSDDRCPIDNKPIQKAIVDYSYRAQQGDRVMTIAKDLPGYQCTDANCGATQMNRGLRVKFFKHILPGLGRLGFSESKDGLEIVLGMKTFVVPVSEKPGLPLTNRQAIMRDGKLTLLP